MPKLNNPFKPYNKVRCINCRGNEYTLKRGEIYTVYKIEGRYIALDEIRSFFLASKFELVEEDINDCLCLNSAYNERIETIFKNSDGKWFLRNIFNKDKILGLEELEELAYTEIKYCPFCGRKL